MSDRPKRILLKISGQSFCRTGETGIHMEEITSICAQIKRVVDQGACSSRSFAVAETSSAAKSSPL